MSAAAVYRRQGDFEAAWRALDDALAMAPEGAPVLELMGDLNLDQGEYEAAAQCYRRVLQI
ncbi:MAG: tetratricopeptide repeat protein, partial [Armatimonadetes bacterium]|nr:tetratricopeptide repeat protein [Armatimonadota bacterium]